MRRQSPGSLRQTRAEQAVDSFFVRMGDVASAAWVVVGASALGLGVRGFALTNVVLVVLWLVLAVAIVREQRRLPASAPEARAP